MTLHLHVGYGTASLSSPDIPADWCHLPPAPTFAAFAAVVLRATDHQALAQLNASALPFPVFVIGHLEYAPESQLKNHPNRAVGYRESGSDSDRCNRV